MQTIAIVYQVLRIGLRVVYLLLLVRFIASWFSASRYGSYGNYRRQNSFVQFVDKVTEPLVAPFQGIFPSIGIDLSPIIVFFILRFFIEPLLTRIFFGL